MTVINPYKKKGILSMILDSILGNPLKDREPERISKKVRKNGKKRKKN